MKRITILMMTLVTILASCGNGAGTKVPADTSQARVDTFNNRKGATPTSADSTNQPHGADKQ